MGKFNPQAKNMVGFHYRYRLISNLLAPEVAHPQTFHPFGNLQEHHRHYAPKLS